MAEEQTQSIPLQTWVDIEAKKQIALQQMSNGASYAEHHKLQSIIRKTTVAYGIAELMRHVRAHPSLGNDDEGSQPSPPLPLPMQCSIDNFVVRVKAPSKSTVAGNPLFSTMKQSWNDIKGVDIVSPRRSVNIFEPSFLCGSIFSDDSNHGEDDISWVRYLEAEFSIDRKSSGDAEAAAVVTMAFSQIEEDIRCRSLGALIYELFSQLSLLPVNGGHDLVQEPSLKKSRLFDISGKPTPATMEKSTYVPLMELGFPSSICLLVRNLLQCEGENRPEDAYDSLDLVIKDLHLLLLDPSRFLFDHDPVVEKGRMQLSFRKNKLYGREKEVSLITDAFCRVSGGTSEAFFIGGYSGSGKSMLVNSLTARVEIAEGYVLTHKFDQMSRERPMWEVIAVFNELCHLIRDKSSQQELLSINNNLIDAFGTDSSMLARLLPSVDAICPQLKGQGQEKARGEEQMNLRSICFLLQRFMRVVSSKSHPVMLFLDDLQWCDDSALAVIEAILSDACGSSCLFFVGSYRDNEVEEDHTIFSLIKSLSSVGVQTTELSLGGLSPEDLNTLLSDSMCMFPRICEPLSDIVYQKTKGNPFFVLEFLQSLVDDKSLEYSLSKKCWVWDEDHISSMDITGNVLYLLSSKMIRMSEDVQLALKVAACFGTRVKELVVRYLSMDSEYANIHEGLKQAVREGFVVKMATDFKFVHDKVQEAAYSLIPESEKNQYHYKLGVALHTVTKGSDINDIVFSIADRINHSTGASLMENPELKVEFAELNEMAGTKAINLTDFASACSYFSVALSQLPNEHWKSHYDQSLRLYLLQAKCCFSSGDVDKAYALSQTILTQAHNLNDKLDADHLIIQILYDREALEEAYTKNCGVLSQLGEAIPDFFGQEQTKEMARDTSAMLADLTGESLFAMKEANEEIQSILKFYACITSISYNAQPTMVPYFTCRMCQLTMQHGICKYSITGLVQYAAMCCNSNIITSIKGACRIGKLAMAALKKFDFVSDMMPRLLFIYNVFIGMYTQRVQLCADNLRRGFECGISCGDISTSCFNAIHHIRICIIAGIDLQTILDKTNYYLHIMKRYRNRHTETILSMYRDTISILMGEKDDYAAVPENLHRFPAETTIYQMAFRAFWIGHSERSHHFAEKLMQGSLNGLHHRALFMMYYGLSSLKLIKRTSTQKLKAVPPYCLRTLKAAMDTSQWNFGNKVYLLEAEIYSHEGQHEEARASYAAAISTAQSSQFIHEQGLACELAGFHCKKLKDHKSAWDFFNQAKQCYSKWGSQMKVDKMTSQLESVQMSLA